MDLTDDSTLSGLIVFRPISEGDHSFLLSLYRSNREQELELFGLSEKQKQQFITTQFTAQHHHYQTHYPSAAFDLVLYQDQPIGHLYVDEWPDQFRIVDIALLPQYSNIGIGSWLLKQVRQKAAETNKATSIHVKQTNPALRLYQRLGFLKCGEHGIYDLMEWSPN